MTFFHLRFCDIKKDSFNIIAALCHPKFKTDCIPNEIEKTKAVKLFMEEFNRISNVCNSSPNRYRISFASARFINIVLFIALVPSMKNQRQRNQAEKMLAQAQRGQKISLLI